MLKKYVPMSATDIIDTVTSTVSSEVAISDSNVKDNFSPVESGKTCEVVAEKGTIEEKPENEVCTSAIEVFFSEANIFITEKNVPDFGDIIYLVKTIAECLPLSEDFLHSLRKANCSQNGYFEYSLKSLPLDKRSAVLKIANTMKNCGVFSNIQITNWNIVGNVSTASKVRNFLSGVWLELYSQRLTTEIVRKFAESKNLSYELYSNLKVEDKNGIKHEIDLMFSVGDKVFGAEIKSGLNFCDYDRYRLTAEWMHLIPDRFLLLNSTLIDDNAIKCISYFYQYFICSLDTYEEKLSNMLNKAFEG